jgi:hypothetical protein
MDSALLLITDQVRAAAAAGTALRIRGGGSKDFYGEPAVGELLDTRPLGGITSYEPSELVVTVRAGTPLACPLNRRILKAAPPRLSPRAKALYTVALPPGA